MSPVMGVDVGGTPGLFAWDLQLNPDEFVRPGAAPNPVQIMPGGNSLRQFLGFAQMFED